MILVYAATDPPAAGLKGVDASNPAKYRKPRKVATFARKNKVQGGSRHTNLTLKDWRSGDDARLGGGGRIKLLAMMRRARVAVSRDRRGVMNDRLEYERVTPRAQAFGVPRETKPS